MGRTRGPLIDADYERWQERSNRPRTSTEILMDLASSTCCDLALTRLEDPNKFRNIPYEQVISELGMAAIDSGLSVPEVLLAIEMGEAKIAKRGLYDIPKNAV